MPIEGASYLKKEKIRLCFVLGKDQIILVEMVLHEIFLTESCCFAHAKAFANG